MDAFDMRQIEAGHREAGELYHEFFSADRLSVGLYVLEAGATDPQTSHTEDEIYYIASGSGTLKLRVSIGRLVLALLSMWTPT